MGFPREHIKEMGLNKVLRHKTIVHRLKGWKNKGLQLMATKRLLLPTRHPSHESQHSYNKRQVNNRE